MTPSTQRTHFNHFHLAKDTDAQWLKQATSETVAFLLPSEISTHNCSLDAAVLSLWTAVMFAQTFKPKLRILMVVLTFLHFCWSGHSSSRLRRSVQTSLAPDSSSSWVNPRHFQVKCEVQPTQQVLGLPQSLCPVRCAWYRSSSICPKRWPVTSNCSYVFRKGTAVLWSHSGNTLFLKYGPYSFSSSTHWAPASPPQTCSTRGVQSYPGKTQCWCRFALQPSRSNTQIYWKSRSTD